MMERLSKTTKLLASPQQAAFGARAGARIALDHGFESNSPLPMLPDVIARAISSTRVCLPPQILRQSGNQSVAGLLSMVGLARLNDSKTVFEIGTYNGLTALTLAINLPKSRIHTLDIPINQAPTLPLERNDASHILARTDMVYSGQEEENRIVQHLGDSATFDFSDFHNTCDLVYIDGAHSYEYVASDTKSARRLANSNGIIVWDDYWRNVPDVPRFLHSLPQGGMFRVPNTRLVVWLSQSTITSVHEQHGFTLRHDPIESSTTEDLGVSARSMSEQSVN